MGYVAVIGDPCSNPAFTTPAQAPELICENGKLKGATFSDNGHVILSLFFTTEGSTGLSASTAVISTTQKTRALTKGNDADASTMVTLCSSRKNQGYNSGMGAIFVDL